MKNIRITLAFLALFFLAFQWTGCIVQGDYYNTQPQPTNYYTHLFQEDFFDDSRSWSFDSPSDSVYAFVKEGYYKFVDYSKTGGYNIAAVGTGANVNQDFLVETRMKSNNPMALIFGASPSSFGYSFYIDPAGYVAVYKEGLQAQIIVNWVYSEAIKTGWNDVALEQVGDYWYGYVNGKKVFQTPARGLAGNQMGYMVFPNTIGYADFLSIKW